MVNTNPEIPQPSGESETPEPLKLTEEEQQRVDALVDTHGRRLALLLTLPRGRAERIIGAEESARILNRLAEQPDRPEPEGPSHDELIELLRGTYPASASDTEKPTDKEA